MSTTHLTGDNLKFIEQIYAQYLNDPGSVDASWLPLFKEYLDLTSVQDLSLRGPNFAPRSIFSPPVAYTNNHASLADDESAVFIDLLDGTKVHTPGKTKGFAANVEALVRAYRLHGHVIAQIDPLGRRSIDDMPELDPKTYGITEDDMSTKVRYADLFNGLEVTLGQVISRLRDIYCRHIGTEYQYISDSKPRQWLRQQIERNDIAEIEGPEERRYIYKGLIDADAFESFLHKKYVGAKRFSVTGGDSLIPMTRALLNEAGDLGVEEVLIGMAHRGRLNVLHNIMDKSAEAMFSEFEKTQNPEKYIGSSDVKYHMGYSSEYSTPKGKGIHLSMAFNPSHLEFVNPVVLGRARAKQARLNTEDAKERIMPLLLHGDAAFAGQGVVSETFNLCDLDGYTVGGTIHIVINNQVGFTTNPEEGRSTRYATDVAKMLEIPIFHVNGNNPEACAIVAKLAMRYRKTFGRDVVIDLVCYRRYGHNEADEPRFTQPKMYKAVDAMPPVWRLYANTLVAEGVYTEEEAQNIFDTRIENYNPAFNKIHGAPLSKHVSTLEGLWAPFKKSSFWESNYSVDTSLSAAKVQELGTKIATIPDSFEAHRTVSRLFRNRQKMMQGELGFDWGMGEGLAFASLLDEGTSVRVSGQDCVRGTFGHRHAAVRNAQGEAYWPARNLHKAQGQYEVINSLLSETAVLGFEYGFSLDSPDSIVIWEAQFGDFVNGAQVIIDQFINSGEDKWQRFSGLVMLLPHGYEGQGPEHSSARLERFLQLSAEDNMFVCNLTTPAQYFHALRRQRHINIRKPMIIMSPKSLLRLKDATSSLDEFTQGHFQHIIPETRKEIDPAKVDRVLLCSGKVYYDLLKYATAQDITNTAILRIEQLYPLDKVALQTELAKYSTPDKKIVWVQEEPKNMGSWHYIFPELFETFGTAPTFCGRLASASPATGDPESHALEQRLLVQEAFGQKAHT